MLSQNANGALAVLVDSIIISNIKFMAVFPVVFLRSFMYVAF